jgi:hypothetical protein
MQVLKRVREAECERTIATWAVGDSDQPTAVRHIIGRAQQTRSDSIESRVAA